jgi:hypothetical protein
MRRLAVIAVVVVLGVAGAGVPRVARAVARGGAAVQRAAAGVAGGRSEAKPAAARSDLARAVADGWPDSREGELAFRWVNAFGRGDSAMRAFYLADLAEKSLAEKGMEARLGRYRELRERFGTLALGSVVKAVPGELTVRLLDADAATHTFIFKAETAPPFRLLSVGIQQQVPGGHGGGHGGWKH